MKVLIADGQAEVRSALTLLLEHGGEACETDVADSLDELVRKAGTGKYDILLLDWELTGGINASTVKLLRRLLPGTGIIAMSVHPESEAAAMRSGADVFISKGENSDKLIRAIQVMGKDTGQKAR